MHPEFLCEYETSWDYLKKSELPLFLYGMGDGADKILSVMGEKNIPCAGFFASNEFVRGQTFHGYKVHTLSEIEENVGEFNIALCFGAGYESLYNRIKDISSRHTLLAPDVPVYGGGLFDLEFVKDNSDKFSAVYNMLRDEKSKKTYADVINAKISGKISYLDRCRLDKNEDILKLDKVSEYIDMGAYNGDSVIEFSERVSSYGKIYAVEPDAKNYKKLVKNTEKLHDVVCINAAVWSKKTVIDFSDKSGRQSAVSPMKKTNVKKINTVYGDGITENADYIKMDVEGSEHEAILGIRKSLEKGCKLKVALYHRNEDLFDIPLLVKSINPKLEMYVRHDMYFPAWETNLYCK